MISLKIDQSSDSEEEEKESANWKKKEIIKPKLPIVNNTSYIKNDLFDDEAMSPEKSTYSLRNGKARPQQRSKEPEGCFFLFNFIFYFINLIYLINSYSIVWFRRWINNNQRYKY